MSDEYDIWDEDDYRFPVESYCPVCKILVNKYAPYADWNIHFHETRLDGANRIYYTIKYWLPKIPSSNVDLTQKHIHFSYYGEWGPTRLGEKLYSIEYYLDGSPGSSDHYDSIRLKIRIGLREIDELILQILMETAFPYGAEPDENHTSYINYQCWEQMIETATLELLEKHGTHDAHVRRRLANASSTR